MSPDVNIIMYFGLAIYAVQYNKFMYKYVNYKG